jgi:5-oxoprolinase (ATP-hydrolysing)
LSVTDANLFLGRIRADHFPKIFGFSNDEALNMARSREGFEKLALEIAKDGGK